MLMAFDIGNTNITIGLFDDATIHETWRVNTDSHRLSDEYGILLLSLLSVKQIDPSAVTEIVMCSVVPPLTPILQEVCRTYFRIEPVIVATGIKTGIKILYDNPRDVGADRIADAVAATQLYGSPIIIVDFGTATVLDAINQRGEYLGGAITPGLSISAEALYKMTSQLRRVELVPPDSPIGRNTITAIQSGLVYGHVATVEGMIERFRRELGANCKVIATGGLSDKISQLTTSFDAVNPHLTLIGLRLIHELNKPT